MLLIQAWHFAVRRQFSLGIGCLVTSGFLIPLKQLFLIPLKQLVMAALGHGILSYIDLRSD